MRNKYSYLIIPLITLCGLVAAALLYGAEKNKAITWVLEATLIVGTLPLLYKMLRDLFRGHFGVDVIAIVAILTAFALGQYLAGCVVVLMLSGGEALEDYAMLRAKQELTNLLKHAPSIAHKKQGTELVEISVGDIRVGDIIVVKPGEIIPVDGIVMQGESLVDESALTGESMPVEKFEHGHVASGSINEQNPLEIKTLKESKDSKYQQIVDLVKQAQESRAPIVRLADRYSVVFTVITFAIAVVAWILFKDPIRILSVLVVATPCPLILATPIAIISGISRAASRGVIVKNGGALETLGEAKAFIFDKTGTLTLGEPKVVEVKGYGLEEKEVMRLAASLDQLSAHILARSLVRHARNEQVEFLYPEQFTEVVGHGVKGVMDGMPYSFGKLSFLRAEGIAILEAAERERELSERQGEMVVYLAKGKKLVGTVHFADTIRHEAKNLFLNLKNMGIRRNLMLTGDKREVASRIASELHIGHYEAECLPEDKVTHVKNLQREYGTVVMVGDGINDAPALAAANVGIALGTSASSASSDAGDIVITVNTIERVAEALSIAKRVLKIAKEGIFFGIGVSIALMIFAALGFIKPVYGALLQEVLDVIVILNALRVNIHK